MLNKIGIYLTLIVAISISSCERKKLQDVERIGNTHASSRVRLSIRHARNLSFDYDGNIAIVNITKPFKAAQKPLKYYLIPKGEIVPDSLKSKSVIKTPVDKFVCTSTTHLPSLEMLGLVGRLIGFPSTHFISSEVIQSKVKAGAIVDLGKDFSLNTELLLSIEPDLLMTFTLDGNYKHLAPVESSGIGTIVNADYLENTPLGRAEWVKLFGLLFSKEQMADSIFNKIELDYNNAVLKASEDSRAPSVFCGIDYKGIWYMPGGNSWMGKFLKDANSNYLWKDNTETGSMELSFESVFDKAHDSDFWINVGSFSSLDALLNSDERYGQFKALSKKSIFNSDARVTDTGGNDYFESGFARPDIVLKDFVKIFHPELLPDHKLYYFQQLK